MDSKKEDSKPEYVINDLQDIHDWCMKNVRERGHVAEDMETIAELTSAFRSILVSSPGTPEQKVLAAKLFIRRQLDELGVTVIEKQSNRIH